MMKPNGITHKLRNLSRNKPDIKDSAEATPKKKVQPIHLQIRPDSRLDNMNVERLAQALCNYQNMLQRYQKGEGLKQQPFFSFEIALRTRNTVFQVSCLPESETVVRKAIESTWNRVAIDKIPDTFRSAPDYTSTVEYNYHYTFAIRVDRRTNGMLENLLETLNAMKSEDEVYVQILGVPAQKDWYVGATEGYQKFKEGKMPRKVRFNKEAAGRMVLNSITKTLIGVTDTIIEATGGKAETWEEPERAVILKDGNLRTETIQKARGEAYKTYIRVGIVCKDKIRASALNRMVTLAFRELDGDNYLIANTTNPERTFKLMKERSEGLKLSKDYFSLKEFARLILLPSGTLQEHYKIPNINTLEVEIPKRLLEGGMLFGHQEFKGRQQDVFLPINNHDEICLPFVVIGGMGQGKTKGFGANKVVQAVRNGFGALCIDPAKGEMGNEIASQLPPEQIIRINLGETPIAIDWRETEHAVRSRNRLANTIISFFGEDDTGGQTTRFIRASVMGMRTTNIKELLRMFEDETYLKEVIKSMPDTIHKQTLKNLSEYSEGRRRQILDPIYNRLDDILGDEYLAECFDAKEGLDMVKLMSQRKAVIIDIPQRLVGETGVNLIGNLIMTKINLAMTLRAEEDQFPFFIIIDEPHQFSRSQSIWKSACVESRKWRVGYNFLFHEWAQLDRDLRDIIKAAGCQYHIYPSSKKTFIGLAEEIQPFTLEDAMKMKTYHSISIIRSGGEQIKPFICKMTRPPSQQPQGL
jgi:hypothetical protein